MLIKKLLKVNGNAEVNAVLIEDGGEEYPIFLESLHNNVYLPMLLESGYILIGMGFEFKKDGVSTNTLPTESIVLSDAALGRMYDSLGRKLPYDEIKSYINEEAVDTLPVPPTNYAIHTREEFLEFLRKIEEFPNEEDYKPINSFVHPEALFTANEYRSTVNAKWVSILEKRRDMSHVKMRKLFNWLKEKELVTDNADGIDLIEAYFAWGIDGIKYQAISKSRETSSRLLSDNDCFVPVVKNTIGAIDSYRNQIIADDDKKLEWKPSDSEKDLVEIVRNTPAGQITPIWYETPGRVDVIVIECLDYTIKFNVTQLSLFGRIMPTLRLQSLTMIDVTEPAENILPKNEVKLKEASYIKALAKLLYQKRASYSDLSSYRALILSGCGPLSALRYVTILDGANRDTIQTNDSLPQVTEDDLLEFLEAGFVANEDVNEYLNDIIAGRYNIDHIASAYTHEASVSTTSTEIDLSVAHRVLGIPLTEIYEKISNIQENDKVLVFSDGRFELHVDVSKLTYVEKAFKRDLNEYNIKCSSNCTAFTYVTKVAREIGENGAKRHIAMEFYVVDKGVPAVKEVLTGIKDAYIEKIAFTQGLSPEMRDQLLALREVFAMTRFFEIRANGYYNYPKQLGGERVDVDAKVKDAVYKNILTKIESLPKYTEFTVGGTTANDLKFSIYCTNAIVTPDAVFPRSGATSFKVVTLTALWYDHRTANPNLYNMLLDAGVIDANHIPWEARYMDEQYVIMDLDDFYNSIHSLARYVEYCAEYRLEYPKELEFEACPHMLELIYPGLYPDEVIPKVLDTPRSGPPAYRAGVIQNVSLNDYSHLYVSTPRDNSPETYIRPFQGHSAEGYYCEPNLNNLLPEGNRCMLVQTGSENIYLSDTDTSEHFTNIHLLAEKGYCVLNVYGRVWLLMDILGKLWEVRI